VRSVACLCHVIKPSRDVAAKAYIGTVAVPTPSSSSSLNGQIESHQMLVDRECRGCQEASVRIAIDRPRPRFACLPTSARKPHGPGRHPGSSESHVLSPTSSSATVPARGRNRLVRSGTHLWPFISECEVRSAAAPLETHLSFGLRSHTAEVEARGETVAASIRLRSLH
jgi:hypothetical protein